MGFTEMVIIVITCCDKKDFYSIIPQNRKSAGTAKFKDLKYLNKVFTWRVGHPRYFNLP